MAPMESFYRGTHKLSEINAVERQAICAVCGPVGITPRSRWINDDGNWIKRVEKQEDRRHVIHKVDDQKLREECVA